MNAEESGKPELEEIEAELKAFCKAISPKPRPRFDFFAELRGVDVRITLYNEKTISGRILEVRRYWVMLTPDGGSTVYYLNKAWVVSIQPLKVRSK
jgi:sRNA-binding regulator protein Hfq